MPLTRRERYAKRLEALRLERSSWEPAWKDIVENVIPYRAVWNSTKRNRGDKEESKIINNTPVRALSTLAAGMMAGITSPARKWFSLTVSDPDLAEHKTVKAYLDQVQEIIESKLQASNWYTSLSNGTYLDLGAIGTSCMFAEEGQPGEMNFRPLAVGEYFLDHNEGGKVDVCFRELPMTVRQMAQKFGVDRCSPQVRQAYEKGDYNQAFDVCHAIMPNDEYSVGGLGRHGKPFASCWWEKTDNRPDAQFLLEGGYEEFPLLAPRWFVRPGDVYGRGPGWEVRGDCRALQHKETNLLKMIDKIVSPPMRAVGNIKRASLLPGDVTHLQKDAGAAYEPAMTIPPEAINRLEAHILRDEERIKEAFYVHLWQALIDDERAQRPTATEVEAKRQEVMLMLGPLLENLDNGLLEPAVERTYNVLARADMLPAMPDELRGHEIRVNFVSIMHEMQKTTGLAGLRALVAETTALAQICGEAVDMLNADAIVEEIGKSTGAPSGAIRTKEEVEKLRASRAQREQTQQEGEAALAATQGIKNVGSADPSKVSEIASMFSPVAAAQGGALGSVKAG